MDGMTQAGLGAGASDVRTSPEIGELAEALAAAQGEMPMPDKDREVTVRPQNGAPYRFSYSTLDNIVATIRPTLAKHGLAIVQPVVMVNREPVLVTRLLHRSGQWIESAMAIAGDRSRPQAFGSALSYARRYAMTSLLLVTADDDDDANEAQGNQVTERRDRPRQPPPPPGSMREAARQVEQERQDGPAAEAIPLMGPDGTLHRIGPGNGGKTPAVLVWAEAWRRALHSERLGFVPALKDWRRDNDPHLETVRRIHPAIAATAQQQFEDRLAEIDGVFPGDLPPRQADAAR